MNISPKAGVNVSPKALLIAAWLGVVLYAFPGYMSFDSVLQLEQARTGVFGLGHPPVMGVLWALCDAAIAGPLGMLLIQVTCFVAGAYLLLRQRLSARAAATATLAIAWFPPIATVLAVIWKDSQMTGFLVLGIALLLSPRRGTRLAGLAVLSLATAMRYNALTITLAPVVLLFVWSPQPRWYVRYPLALAAWIAITVVPSVINAQLVSERVYLWHDSLALCDITGTLRYADDLPDAELAAALAGTPALVTTDIQRTARTTFPPDSIPIAQRPSFGGGTFIPSLWTTTFHLFEPPTTAAQRDAITAAWRAIVLGHPGAYLAYRWEVFREVIHLGDRRISSAVYSSFTDSGDRAGSAKRLGHNAVSSHLQRGLHTFMGWIATSWLFRPWIYVALSLVCLPLCVRDRRLLALVLSGLANEAALLVLAPTTDFRYSIWLVVSTVLAIVWIVTLGSQRTRNRASAALDIHSSGKSPAAATALRAFSSARCHTKLEGSASTRPTSVR